VPHSILDSKTKVRGTLSDGKIEFEEYEVIKGVDDVDGESLSTLLINQI